jgi:peroxiredoxin
MKLLIKSLAIVVFTLFTTNTQSQAVEKAEDICPILVGDTIPSAILRSNEGKQVNLLDKVKEKPTVMVFYRGGWCPFCNVQLAGLAQIQKDVVALGYQIIAISPDEYAELKTTESKNKVNYTVLSDSAGIFIEKLGIGFKTPAKMRSYIENKNTTKASGIMPVPTVLVLNKMGTVLFEYLNPNYKERISGEMLLAVLKTIKK